jgi:hypothetical protein
VIPRSSRRRYWPLALAVAAVDAAAVAVAVAAAVVVVAAVVEADAVVAAAVRQVVVRPCCRRLTLLQLRRLPLRLQSGPHVLPLSRGPHSDRLHLS